MAVSLPAVLTAAYRW